MSLPVPDPQKLQAFLRSRASIRKFNERPVENKVLDRVLETACWAPSAHNRQPWRFVVLQDKKALDRLVAAMAPDYRAALERAELSELEIKQRMEKRSVMIGGAAIGVLLCLNSEDMEHYPDDPARQSGEEMMAVQSVALAGCQLLLAAHAEGLGAVWMGAPLFAQQAVLSAFELPHSWQPQALILLGYAAEEPSERHRKTLSEVVRYV
jgi:coenzyme F420-0:L-glutamate ligase/coenzyme F420-1:gamma-L-glutamate ligase